jgi:hypothetical protein
VSVCGVAIVYFVDCGNDILTLRRKQKNNKKQGQLTTNNKTEIKGSTFTERLTAKLFQVGEVFQQVSCIF